METFIINRWRNVLFNMLDYFDSQRFKECFVVYRQARVISEACLCLQ